MQLTDDLLAELSSLNDALRLERNAQGELEILPPAQHNNLKEKLADNCPFGCLGRG